MPLACACVRLGRVLLTCVVYINNSVNNNDSDSSNELIVAIKNYCSVPVHYLNKRRRSEHAKVFVYENNGLLAKLFTLGLGRNNNANCKSAFATFSTLQI